MSTTYWWSDSIKSFRTGFKWTGIVFFNPISIVKNELGCWTVPKLTLVWILLLPGSDGFLHSFTFWPLKYNLAPSPLAELAPEPPVLDNLAPETRYMPGLCVCVCVCVHLHLTDRCSAAQVVNYGMDRDSSAKEFGRRSAASGQGMLWQPPTPSQTLSLLSFYPKLCYDSLFFHCFSVPFFTSPSLHPSRSTNLYSSPFLTSFLACSPISSVSPLHIAFWPLSHW